MVKLLRPTSLKEAIGLARLQEKHHCKDRRSFSTPNKPTTFVAITPTKPSPSLKPQRLSYDEMKARRDKGLCYYCDEKLGPGHKCKTLTFFFLEGQEDSDIYCSDDDSPVSPPPTILLHAISGVQMPQTMRVTGTVANRSAFILIDSGNTHNFMDPSIAKKANLPISQTTNFTVMVANRDKLSSEGKCSNTKLSVQGIPMVTYFLSSSFGRV
ncbi:hypothetical protein Patl1_04621 [Pistacia atlantica]|uniref:Uncharacterized protein n=1 Tax=Pistacia atlantica TaxID=434234 RepID=A0ACC1BPW7_9ROSI|nr:hypothetical protein Patl1_04621 [Pistacia atlantica]